MRFLTFAKNGVETAGLCIGDSVIDLSVAAAKLPSTLLGLIRNNLLEKAADMAAHAPAEATIPVSSIRYLPVVPRPQKVVNLIWHEGAERPAAPGVSISVSSRLCGHLEPMLVPKTFGKLDYGVELAVVLSKGGRHIAQSTAVECIAGYTVFNGGVVRGVPSGQTVAVARNSDRTAPLGPELVTPDELPPLAAGLQVTLKRNGRIVQSGTTASFWNVAEAIARTSTYMTLDAGDIITMGTLGGTAFDLGSDYLRAGEVLEAEIEGIGILLNPIENQA